ncbi:MAG: branched-chain amino acid ABC transporter permease [Gloeobacteraceae cyanobacterium ES-bin-144]|nr:branched-chain amino acid ABC transporter permease [Verrucomicrobiales bacterium]
MQRSFKDPRILLLLAVVLTVIAGLGADLMNAYYRDVVVDIGIAIILAVSLNLINGHTGQFSLGHAGFMSVGAYVSAMLTLALQKQVGVAALPWLFLPTLLAGGIVAALAGLLVGVPSLRLRGDYLAIVTLGFGEIIRVIFQNVEAAGAASGLSGIPRLTGLGWTFTLAALTVYVVACLVNSTYGRGFIAVHDDEIAASSMGLNPTRYKVTAFVIGAFFAGIAGGLFAHHKTTITPQVFDFMKSFEVVVMVILGGMGRTAGVILAAIILTLAPEFLRSMAEYRMIIYALLIIFIMIARPQGLFHFERKKKSTAPQA